MTPHLYDDVIPCFEWLRERNIRIGIITNGNADLMTCQGLSQYLEFCVTANSVGSMKPSPVPFIAALHRANLPPQRILYVGDSYDKVRSLPLRMLMLASSSLNSPRCCSVSIEKDVLGARAVGMHTALLVRSLDSEIHGGALASVRSVLTTGDLGVMDMLPTSALVTHSGDAPICASPVSPVFHSAPPDLELTTLQPPELSQKFAGFIAKMVL